MGPVVGVGVVVAAFQVHPSDGGRVGVFGFAVEDIFDAMLIDVVGFGNARV